jgi:anti-anti-sigma factor
VDIQVRKAGEVTVLDLSGRLVLGQEAKLTTAVAELFAGGTRYLAVNLAAVPMMDSSGIGSIVRAHTSAVRAGGRCRFYAATKMVMQTLKMVRLDTLLELCDDETSALAGFQ